MGKSLSDDIIDRIVDASSFKFMKKNKSTNPDAAYENEMDTKNEKSFMRKGKASDASLPSVIRCPIVLYLIHLSH